MSVGSGLQPSKEMTMSDNPYTSLPERAFWRPSVSARNPLSLVDLYEKKFDLTRTDRIVTAGSCFA